MDSIKFRVIGTFLALFLLIYFGLSTKAPEHKLVEKSRALNMQSTDVRVLVEKAKVDMESAFRAQIAFAENEVRTSDSDSTRMIAMEQLASMWYKAGHPAISGHYAMEIAKVREDDKSWSISGTTFALALKSDEVLDETTKAYCIDNSIASFERAISINPENVDNRINMALVYADHPPKDNPMKGILQLLDLNKKYPENTGVMNQLGQLGLKTNQFDKAEQRFLAVLKLDNINKSAICGLAQVYAGLGKKELAERYENQCLTLENKS